MNYEDHINNELRRSHEQWIELQWITRSQKQWSHINNELWRSNKQWITMIT